MKDCILYLRQAAEERAIYAFLLHIIGNVILDSKLCKSHNSVKDAHSHIDSFYKDNNIIFVYEIFEYLNMCEYLKLYISQ